MNEHKPSLSVATVGTKGQIVIPLEVREKLNVQPGDKVVLMLKHQGVAVLFPMHGIRQWLESMTEHLDGLKNLTNKTVPVKTKQERHS